MEKGGGITIKEQIVRGANGTGKIQLHLSDSGPGIPKSILHKIFQPFFSTKEEGTGLGLSIVSRIIEEHGGTIAVESEEGKGATFIICLPLKEQQIEQHHFNHRR
jgi:signal transduction histidine kinase